MPNKKPRFESPRALHERITLELRSEIATGGLVAGARLPSEHELADRFGVSRGTVRQALAALRHNGLIEAVPGRGSFVRRAAPLTDEARRRAVGVVVPSVAKPYVPEILAGIEDQLHHQGYSMLVGSSGSTSEQEAGRIDRLLREGASGLIVYPIDCGSEAAIFEQLLERDFPIVFIDRYLPGIVADSVVSDNVGGAFAAASHLIDLGHRRIGFVSTDNMMVTTVLERYQGYQQALLHAGLDFDPGLVLSSLSVSTIWPTGDRSNVEENVARIAPLLERDDCPSAVLTLHDVVATYVFEAARSIGLRVPGDLAIVGFDDEPLARSHIVPLTTVWQPRERMGARSAELLVDRLEGRRDEIARLVLPTRLIVRRSSGGALTDREVEESA